MNDDKIIIHNQSGLAHAIVVMEIQKVIDAGLFPGRTKRSPMTYRKLTRFEIGNTGYLIASARREKSYSFTVTKHGVPEA